MAFHGGSTVPANKFQQKLQQQHHLTLRPGASEYSYALCKILLVFDGETLNSLSEDGELSLPDAWREEIYQNPGLLFALVVIPTGQVKFLPFKQDAGELFEERGNSLCLEGLDAKIEYMNLDVDAGSIVLQRNYSKPFIDLVQSTRVADIGSIFGR